MDPARARTPTVGAPHVTVGRQADRGSEVATP